MTWTKCVIFNIFNIYFTPLNFSSSFCFMYMYIVIEIVGMVATSPAKKTTDDKLIKNVFMRSL